MTSATRPETVLTLLDSVFVKHGALGLTVDTLVNELLLVRSRLFARRPPRPLVRAMVIAEMGASHNYVPDGPLWYVAPGSPLHTELGHILKDPRSTGTALAPALAPAPASASASASSATAAIPRSRSRSSDRSSDRSRRGTSSAKTSAAKSGYTTQAAGSGPLPAFVTGSVDVVLRAAPVRATVVAVPVPAAGVPAVATRSDRADAVKKAAALQAHYEEVMAKYDKAKSAAPAAKSSPLKRVPSSAGKSRSKAKERVYLPRKLTSAEIKEMETSTSSILVGVDLAQVLTLDAFYMLGPKTQLKLLKMLPPELPESLPESATELPDTPQFTAALKNMFRRSSFLQQEAAHWQHMLTVGQFDPAYASIRSMAKRKRGRDAPSSSTARPVTAAGAAAIAASAAASASASAAAPNPRPRRVTRSSSGS